MQSTPSRGCWLAAACVGNVDARLEHVCTPASFSSLTFLHNHFSLQGRGHGGIGGIRHSLHNHFKQGSNYRDPYGPGPLSAFVGPLNAVQNWGSLQGPIGPL